MKTMTEQWKQYRDAVYPQGMSATQSQECHQAFFAGALCAIKSTEAVASLSDEQAFAELTKLNREIVQFAEHQRARMRARN